jgi:hypothetical protein
MGVIADRARGLVERGAPYSEYPCNQLVHYALTGNKQGHLAKEFLNYGQEVTTPQEGDVVVGTDGKHCGIFVDSSHFVHASDSQEKAVEVEISKLRYVFRSGYQIRRK